MESKEILREAINSKIKSITSDDNDINIEFEKESMVISYDHDQDCCENVYADFSSVKYHIEKLIDKNVKEIVFKGIEEIGFLICFYFDWEDSEKIFVPCYNSQNGYYSDKLALIVKRGEIKKEIDITAFKEDNI